jgi:hypothetical protein
MAFLRKVVGSFSQELIRCVDSSLQRLSKEHKSVFAALGWLSGVCGGSFDQSLALALLGQDQKKTRAALHRLHGQTLIVATTATAIAACYHPIHPCLQKKA